MLDPIPQASPLPGGVLERDAHGRPLRRGENLVQAGDDLLDARSLARPQMRAGVQHQKGQPELGGELDLLNEGLDGAVAIVGRRPAEVDEVTRVAEDASEAIRGPFLRISGDVPRRKRLPEPLHVVLNEHLDDLAVDAAASLQGFPNPAAGGHVCAEFHRGLQLLRTGQQLSHAGQQAASGAAIENAMIETEREVGFHDRHELAFGLVPMRHAPGRTHARAPGSAPAAEWESPK